MIEFDGHNKKSFDAGFKARNDIKFFSGKMGITSAEIPKSNASNKVTREIQRLRGIHSLSKMLNSDHLVLVQYPLPFNSFDYKLLHKTLIRHNAKSVFLIHDLISVQGLASNVSVERELDLLKKADFIIAHNDSMASFLKNNGLANRISVINFFDYRVDKIPRQDTNRQILFLLVIWPSHHS